MVSQASRAIDDYCAAHSDQETDLLAELVRVTNSETDLPIMLSGSVVGAFLKMLTGLADTRLAIEIGTFTGYSALWIAAGLRPDGKLICCDIDPDYTAIAQRFWDRSSLGEKIELHLAPALETLEAIEDPIDFAFIDADKTGYPGYWEALVPKMRSGGIVVADNAFLAGGVLDSSPRNEAVAAMVLFNDTVAADTRVERVLLSVRDGLMVARKL